MFTYLSIQSIYHCYRLSYHNIACLYLLSLGDKILHHAIVGIYYLGNVHYLYRGPVKSGGGGGGAQKVSIFFGALRIVTLYTEIDGPTL